jgi:dihydroxyacetone kinase
MTDGGPDDGSLSGPSAGLVSLLRAIATDLLERKDELNRLDGVAGDGDLGLTMSAAANALLELAPSLESLPEADAIRKCGTEIARRAPSTGGTLIAFALMAAAKATIPPGAPVIERAAAYLDAAAASIAQRGQVGEGDRTMLDALRPAADAMRRAADAGAAAGAATADAAAAATRGASATASMPAKVGRAGWLAERAAGHEDAGARLVALIFATVQRHVDGPPQGLAVGPGAPPGT